jgi:hypothetical protein
MKIDHVDIPIKKSWNRIGISLSGGADSALLSYLILKNTSADIYFTTQIRMWKTRPWQRYVAKDVVGWFQENFRNRIQHIENFVPPEMEEPNTTYITDEYGKSKPGNRIILRAHNEFVIHAHKLDAWFAAVNKNPDIDIPGALPERDQGTLPVHTTHMGIDIYHPFVYTKKDWIIKQYIDNGIGELLEITRSCEGEYKDLNYTNYVPYQEVPTCNNCFWCLERKWGIDNALK